MVKQTARKPPPKPGPGRPKGSRNKTTALLKDAILAAAEAADPKRGMVGYLTTQAKKSPSAFLTLLGKVLPIQTHHSGTIGSYDLTHASESDLLTLAAVLERIAKPGAGEGGAGAT